VTPVARKVCLPILVVMPAARASLDHRIGVRLGQGIGGEPAGGAAVGLKQQRLRIVREPRAVARGVGIDATGKVNHPRAQPEKFIDTH
jgi:hypothetical protein